MTSRFERNPANYDIQLPPFPWRLKGLDIGVTIHSTDNVSVVVGCSYCPVAMNFGGVISLSNALSTVQERLSNLIISCVTGSSDIGLSIPDHMDWIVTMWHFGMDSMITYSGEKFNVSWETAQHVLITAYSKDWGDGKNRIRIEKQEYPQKSLAEALDEKLNAIR